MLSKFYWKYNTDHIQSVLQDVVKSEDLKIDITDVSYQNDTCPSLELKSETETYMLFLPNSWRNHEEETNKFLLIYDRDYGTETHNFIHFNDLQEVVSHLIANQNKDLIK